MRKFEKEWTRIEVAARRGARSASRRKQVVQDAIDETLHRWTTRTLAGRAVHDAERWACRVAANLAKRLGKAASKANTSDGLEQLAGAASNALAGANSLAHMRLADHPGWKKKLTKKQAAVVAKLLEPSMSLHRAAKELGVDRTSLRRTFNRACARLRRG